MFNAVQIPDSTSDLLHNLQAAEDRFNNEKDDLVTQVSIFMLCRSGMSL